MESSANLTVKFPEFVDVQSFVYSNGELNNPRRVPAFVVKEREWVWSS